MPWWLQMILLFIAGFVIVRILSDISWLFLPAAGILTIVVLTGYLHWYGWMPRFLTGIKFLNDILDRLTNKQALADRLENSRAQRRIVDAEQLAAGLKARVFGQDQVCDAVAAQIRTRFAREMRTQPVGVFMLAGPPATGKSWFAKVLSRELYGEKSEQLIEMAQFNDSHGGSSLFGAARSYSGSDSYGSLTGMLRTKPDQVIILDEFEKAHPQVQRRFLSAWNDGFITEMSNSEKIPTRDAIFVLTTNAQQREIADLALRYEDDWEGYADATRRELTGVFAPEIISRIDYIFPFLPVRGLDMARILASQTETQLGEYGVELHYFDENALAGFVEEALQRDADPREISRSLERSIAPQIVDLKEENVIKVDIVMEGETVKVVAA